MIREIAVAGAGIVLALSSTAIAATITNHDVKTRMVDVVLAEGDEGDGGMAAIEIASGQTIDDFCMGGCNITMGGGVELNLVGDEDVHIRDGKFEIAE